MYQLIKPLLFSMEPEEAHYFAMNFWQKLNSSPFQQKLVRAISGAERFNRPVEVAGITFPNQVGLAAGFDKDARWVDSLAAMGFGHIEIGTVTPRPQPGNDKPRLFRLVQDEALINRMGFNNQGVEVAVSRLERRQSKVIVGGNIGKNKVTPNEEAHLDYLYCFKKLYHTVDYFTINVSSPNTPNLRELQDKEPLKELLRTVITERKNKIARGEKSKAVFLKIAPDMNEAQLNDVAEIILETGADGVVATNTTISRDGLKTSAQQLEKTGAGGLSGKPLTQKSTRVIADLYKASEGKFAIIGVGGIFSGDDAVAKIDAGASLVQLYTGFIYRGMGLVNEVKKQVIRHL